MREGGASEPSTAQCIDAFVPHVDMMAFMTVIPFVDFVLPEKPLMTLARQVRLGAAYGTTLITSIFYLSLSHDGEVAEVSDGLSA